MTQAPPTANSSPSSTAAASSCPKKTTDVSAPYSPCASSCACRPRGRAVSPRSFLRLRLLDSVDSNLVNQRAPGHLQAARGLGLVPLGVIQSGDQHLRFDAFHASAEVFAGLAAIAFVNRRRRQG